MNTMGKDYVYTVPQKFVDDLGYNSITVSATPTNGDSAVDTYIQLDGSADLDIAGAIEVKGDISVAYVFDGTDVKQNIKLAGRLKSDFLNSADVVANLGMDNTGTYGSLEIGGTIASNAMFAVKGAYIVQFNNTNSAKKVRDIVAVEGKVVGETEYELGAQGRRLAGDGSINVAGEVELKGPLDVAFSADGIKGDVDLTLGLGDFGDAQVVGSLAILANTDEGAVFPVVSYTLLRAHKTSLHFVCLLLLEKKKKKT